MMLGIPFCSSFSFFFFIFSFSIFPESKMASCYLLHLIKWGTNSIHHGAILLLTLFSASLPTVNMVRCLWRRYGMLNSLKIHWGGQGFTQSCCFFWWCPHFAVSLSFAASLLVVWLNSQVLLEPFPQILRASSPFHFHFKIPMLGVSFWTFILFLRAIFAVRRGGNILSDLKGIRIYKKALWVVTQWYCPALLLPLVVSQKREYLNP